MKELCGIWRVLALRCKSWKNGLKIRIEQSSGGFESLSGTILQLRYVIQSINLDEHLDALFLRVLGVMRRGSLCEFSYQASLSLRSIGDPMKNLNESIWPQSLVREGRLYGNLEHWFAVQERARKPRKPTSSETAKRRE